MDGIFLRAQAVRKRNPRWGWRDGLCRQFCWTDATRSRHSRRVRRLHGVVLRRLAGAPEMSHEELDLLQTRHLAYRAELKRQGVVVVTGPFDEQTDPSYRGMSIFACDAAEAALIALKRTTVNSSGVGVADEMRDLDEDSRGAVSRPWSMGPIHRRSG